MLHVRIIHLYCLLTLAHYVDCLERPLFNVTGMSDRLPLSCRIDQSTDSVDIFIEIINVACGGTDSNEISLVSWTFHRMKEDTDYKIDLNNPYKMENTSIASFTWSGLEEPDLSIYAVEVSLTFGVTMDMFTIVGYLVIGCGDNSENYSEAACKSVYDDFKKLAGANTNIWELEKCNHFKSTYKATSRKEYFTQHSQGDEIYSTDLQLKVNSSIVFQVKGESNAYVLLHENKTELDDNAVEIILEDDNQLSHISDKGNVNVRTLSYEAEDILSEEQFRYFWMIFYGDEVRVGKGILPYSEQMLKLDKVNHVINYLSYGNNNSRSATWRFDTDLCNIPMESIGDKRCLEQENWTYNPETLSCNKTCPDTKNCFKSKELCQYSCNAINIVEEESADSFGTMSKEVATNCKDLHKEANGALSNGSYSVSNGNGQTFTVYCQFYNDYGYTFVARNTTIDVDISFLYDNKSHVIIQHKREDGLQYIAKLEQLSRLSSTDLSVQYNGYTGYATPSNKELVPYIYIGFIPQSKITKSETEGWTSNGIEYTFNNCDGNPNSYMAVYFNNEDLSYQKTGSGYNSLMFCWYDFSTSASSDEYLPDDFFTPYFEIHHGGCGGFATGDSVPDILGVAVGLQFFTSLTCLEPEDILHGTKTFSGTNVNDTVTYTCNAGYILITGDLTRTCTNTTEWSGIKPLCGVSLPDNSIASAVEEFEYSTIPEPGECLVHPVTGYTLMTNYNITCSNFTVQGNYTLQYLMKSKTTDEWPKGSKFYTGTNSTVTNVKFPLGDPEQEYRLFILIKVKLIESGAYTETAQMIQVLPADQAPQGSDVVGAAKSLLDATGDSQTSAIDEMLAAGNQEEALQNLNVISSALNPANATEMNDTQLEEKTEIRTQVVESLNKVNVTGIETVSSVAETLTEVTKVKSELSESTQEIAAELLDNLADSLDSFSDVTDTYEIVDSAEDIFTGVTQLLDIKADEGNKQLIKDETNVTDDQVDDEDHLEKIKESASRLLDTIDKVSNTLLSGQAPGDPPIIIETDSMNVQVEKLEQSALGGKNLSMGIGNDTDVATIEFPAVIDGLDENMPDLGLQVYHMKKNPYMWDKSAIDVNMEVLSIELTSNDLAVNVSNLSQPIKVSLAAAETEKPPYSTLLLHIIKSNGKLSYDSSATNMLLTNFTIPKGKTVILSLFTFYQMRNLKILIDELEKPEFENITETGLTYPSDVEQMNQLFSKFELTNETPKSSDLIFFTYNKSMSVNYTGTYFLGVTVDLNDTKSVDDLRDLDIDCIGNDNITYCESTVELTLHIDTVTLSCTYWDTTTETWSHKGCEVSPLSTKDKLECLCTHLTAFSGGVFVLPNFVDPIGDAALFLTFFDNPVVVTTVVIVWILYFFLIHWSRRSDRKDQEQVGVIPVGDIDAMNKHMYLVCVVTGWWTDAGTTANVFFHMKGVNGSSARIKLTTTARLCFQSGYEDWFLVTTEESLGNLQDITLWHDNSGSSPHWYLSQLFVKDLQDKKSWTFIYNDWLAADRGSALLTTACVPAVTKDELKLNQKHNFMVKTTHDLRDSHIWISIFSKPARSSFTRVQRVTCALSLLLTTMLTNIMFYGIPTDDPDDQVGGSRGVVISLSSIVIGIQSSLIMFPVNVIIMQMFLKLKARPVKEDNNEEGQTFLQSLYDGVSRVTLEFMNKVSSVKVQTEEELYSLPG